MSYGERWEEDLWREYENLIRVYAVLQLAYVKGERLCDKPEKPKEPLVYGKNSVSKLYDKCFAEFTRTKKIRREAFLKFKSEPEVS